MPDSAGTEIIAVRSLTVSDLGIFSAQRSGLRSKQRAINVNARVARAMLSDRLWQSGGSDFRCVCVFDDQRLDGVRPLRLIGKNWRLGGPKIAGAAFGALDSKDFVLLRTREGNDGEYPISIIFFSRNSDRVRQIGIAGVVERSLGQSMALFREGEETFSFLAQHCPALPAD